MRSRDQRELRAPGVRGDLCRGSNLQGVWRDSRAGGGGGRGLTPLKNATLPFLPNLDLGSERSFYAGSEKRVCRVRERTLQ